MTHVIRVDPDGTVTECEGRNVLDVAAAGLAEIGGYSGPSMFGDVSYPKATVDVVAAFPHEFAPFPHPRRALVIVVHEWGVLLRLPINVKAWSLYGRSPVCGPAFLAYDVGQYPLPAKWIETMRGPADWVPDSVLARMRQTAGDQPWPE